MISRDSLFFLLTVSIAMLITRNHAFRRPVLRTIIHSASKTSIKAVNPDPAIMEKFQSHQTSAKKLSLAEEIKTLVFQSTGYGVLSTNSVSNPGFPVGSIVGFHTDSQGKPFFALSTMSGHTKDIIADGRASLCITSKNFKDAADGRVTLIGKISKLPQEKTQAYREEYLKKHKDAFWIDFGDFSYFSLDSIENVRYVGGFARAGSISGEDYVSCEADPLASFSEHVISHMNSDHAESTVAMIKHYIGVEVSDAKILSLDKYGMTVEAKMDFAGGEVSKLRLPFTKEVTDRKAVKEVIVEMTKASSS